MESTGRQEIDLRLSIGLGRRVLSTHRYPDQPGKATTMAIISRTHGYLFIMTPRTGCTAIAEGVLIPKLGGEYFPKDAIRDENGRLLVRPKHSSVAELVNNGLLTREETDRLLKFCAVRNPFDSIVSLYVKQRSTYQDLLEDPGSWVHDRPEYLQGMQVAANEPFDRWLEWLLRPKGRRERIKAIAALSPVMPRHMYGRFFRTVDVVMRYESLQADFSAVLARLGVDDIEIPQLNVTNEREKRDYRSYYTPKARRLAERAFAPDARRFGYAF